MLAVCGLRWYIIGGICRAADHHQQLGCCQTILPLLADHINFAKADLNPGFAGHLSNAGAAPPAQAVRTGQRQGCAGVMQ